MAIAWVFPGQGSQKLGMADEILDLPGAKERFKEASEIIGRDLLEICRSSSNVIDMENPKDLNDTRNTQPALFVVESILLDDLKRQGRQASLVAGHSLGEISALYAAQVFDAKTALLLLKKRSELMAASSNGAMTAVLGFDRQELDGLIKATEAVVIANDNSSAQVVLSGSPEAVNEVSSKLKCKRAIPLQVSGAFHSPFMDEAAKAFTKELDQIIFKNAQMPVISNSEPNPETDANLLKERLQKQMTSGVRWRETMDVMVQAGIDTLIEIGPGNVLSGLAKRSMKGVDTHQIATSKDLGH